MAARGYSPNVVEQVFSEVRQNDALKGTKFIGNSSPRASLTPRERSLGGRKRRWQDGRRSRNTERGSSRAAEGSNRAANRAEDGIDRSVVILLGSKCYF